MLNPSMLARHGIILLTFCLGGITGGWPAAAQAGDADTQVAPAPHDLSPVRELPVANPHLDRSGRKRVGKASFYAKKFSGRKMADGSRMLPQGDNAASKTLPLGTTATVTNLDTGKAATVTIRDRGPYVKGRIVDLSPSTARKIGIDRKMGVARVEVVPIEVPSANP